MWNFRRRARTILDQVRYAECDAAGNVVVSGSAERAVYYTEREDAVLSGSGRLRSEPQGASLQAQVLRCDDDPRRLVTGATDTVELTRDDVPAPGLSRHPIPCRPTTTAVRRCPTMPVRFLDGVPNKQYPCRQ